MAQKGQSASWSGEEEDDGSGMVVNYIWEDMFERTIGRCGGEVGGLKLTEGEEGANKLS